MRLFVAIVHSVVLLTTASASSAAPPIEVVASPEDARLADRVAAELRSMGLEAERGALSAGPAGEIDLLDVARRKTAIAAVRIVRNKRGVEVWVAERATGKTLMRAATLSSADGASTIALRTVELLRASLLELDLGEQARGDVSAADADALRESLAPRGETPDRAATAHGPARTAAPDRAVPASVEKPRVVPESGTHSVRLSFEAGAALVGSPGGLPPFAAAVGVVGLHVSEQVRVGVIGFAPIHAMTHRAAEGESETRIYVVGLDSRYEMLTGVWRPSVATSMVAVFANTEGQPSTIAHLRRTDDKLGVGPTVRPGLSWNPNEHVALRGDAMVGTLIRPFAVLYGGQEVAEWGRVWLSGSICVEGELP